MHLVSVRGFLKPLICLLPELKEFPVGWTVSPSSVNSLLFYLLSNILCLNELPCRVEGFHLRGNHYTTPLQTGCPQNGTYVP